MATEVKTGRLGPFPNVSRPVFTISAFLIVGFILFGAVFTELASTIFTGAQAGIADYFGWFLILTTNLALGLCVYLAFSRYGDIRLGAQTESPEYGLMPWTAMLFSAGIGIGLLYWAVSEPLFHFFAPPMGEPQTIEAAKQAMVLSFLHWGLHGWAIYGIVGLSLAYFHYRNGLPLSVRSALYPLIGERIYGPIGHTVDILAVFGTMFGIVTSLGLGVMQINAGLGIVFGVADSLLVQIALIAGITGLATISVMLGLDGGIKRISSLNIGLSFALLAFIVLTGPTLYIFDSFVENVGNYVAGLITFGTWSEAYSGTNWQVDWTIFYWAWWISWSPFVGIFIARISRGRTVREFILGVLLVPTAILFFWFTAFGGTALNLELAGDPGLIEATKESYGNAIFKLLEFFPFPGLISCVIMVMIVMWFVTSSDSGSFVIDMLTAGGDANPPKIQRMFWAITEGCIAAVLLAAGGLNALQAAAVVAGFPFAFVIIVMMYGLLRGLGRDKLVMYRYKQWYRTEQEAEANLPNAYADEEALKGPPKLAVES
ncbi:BCCT family transporter [Aurantimonas endophytica]|uniref:Choline/glycine/proline betaine transport protein n=1 Tax=Aurantimonas endophytica TaxID=1522175 RepID=A0A7W6HE42_9HYPH|nr:BCCT family transporter [Aurantimonas endophytica]MBB4003534.1 choline/glycine/proline betaine transport protein [Aurantimonas endophytica]MCO6404393.1 BCCT family transporter [Aurantimonas endophytica]